MGSIEAERITLNEKTLWHGGPAVSDDASFYWDVNRKSAGALKKIRRAFAGGKPEMADSLTRLYFTGKAPYEKRSGAPFRFGSFTTMGEIRITTGHAPERISGYRRSLSLDSAVASVSYCCDSVRCFREFFISYPDNVMVIRFRSGGKQRLVLEYSPNPESSCHISGSEGRDPIEDFEIINRELEKFNPELAKRPMLVAGNKCDLATDEQIENFKNYVEEKGYMFFPIMAAIRYDVDPLLNKIQEMLSKLPPIAVYEAEPVPVVAADNVGRHDVKITVHDGIYFVEGKWLLNVIKSVNFDDYESLNYFQKVLINSGVIDALREAGINEGDTVSIYDLEFDFVE